MFCPVCRKRVIDKLPMCAPCWTTVPQDEKRRLGRLNSRGDEYKAAIAELVEQMKAPA